MRAEGGLFPRIVLRETRRALSDGAKCICRPTSRGKTSYTPFCKVTFTQRGQEAILEKEEVAGEEGMEQDTPVDEVTRRQARGPALSQAARTQHLLQVLLESLVGRETVVSIISLLGLRKANLGRR